MALRSAIINVMTAAAEKAARSLVHDFGEVEQLQVSKKGPADFVSTADTNAEAILKEELSKARPGYGFLMEESGTSAGTIPDRRWIVDPLDGTTNFLHGMPHWAISIALEAEGEIVAGVVFDPIKNEMFAAEKGVGAFVNNRRRLRVSSRDNLAESMVATCIPVPGRSDLDVFVPQLRAMAEQNVSIRRLGSAALDLAYVAAGRYEAYWELAIHPWDIAAGILLVHEAGGFTSEADGGGNTLYGGSILASNSAIRGPLAETLHGGISSPQRRMGT